jgi:hypothetical protein
MNSDRDFRIAVIRAQSQAAERMTQHALDLQPEYIFGLWTRSLALCGLGRNRDAVELLERTVILSRAPIFVGLLGFGYARAGRLEDATRRLRELEDRGSRGVHPGIRTLDHPRRAGDIPGIRETLSNVLAKAAPPLSVCVTCGHFLEAARTDPEIRRLHFELFGW